MGSFEGIGEESVGVNLGFAGHFVVVAVVVEC